jgi:hypothetical protein
VGSVTPAGYSSHPSLQHAPLPHASCEGPGRAARSFDCCGSRSARRVVSENRSLMFTRQIYAESYRPSSIPFPRLQPISPNRMIPFIIASSLTRKSHTGNATPAPAHHPTRSPPRRRRPAVGDPGRTPGKSHDHPNQDKAGETDRMKETFLGDPHPPIISFSPRKPETLLCTPKPRGSSDDHQSSFISCPPD